MEQVFTLTFLTGLLAAACCGNAHHLRHPGNPRRTVGVLNLGIEGIMLMGAMTGFLTTLSTGSLWLGVAAAAFTGIILSLLMALLAVWLGLSQHVSGIGITSASRDLPCSSTAWR